MCPHMIIRPTMFMPQRTRIQFLFFLVGVALLSASPIEAQVPQKVITSCTTCSPSEVRAADLDGDGDTDFLSPSPGNDKITWHENDGSTTPSFTERVLTTDLSGDPRDLGGNQLIRTADVDGDSDTDVFAVSTSLTGFSKVVWYENDGSDDPTFTERVVTTDIDNAQSAHVTDLNGDNNPDILVGSEDGLFWYKNDGGDDPSFSKQVINTDVKVVTSLYASDLDGDSDPDIISVSSGDKVAWYENDGQDDPNFSEWIITDDVNDPRSAFATDIDGDSDTDILAISRRDSEIAWYENDGSSQPTFTKRVINSEAYGALDLYATDIDGDSDTDILSAASVLNGASRLAWYENNGDSNPSFTQHTITNDLLRARSVSATDVDGDSDLDLFTASEFDDKIAWFENTGSGFADQQALTTSGFANFALDIFAADIDGDSDTDLLSASWRDSKIAWYENDGTADPHFSEQVVTTNAFAARSVHAADIDGDSDIDVLSASSGDNKIAWHENDGAANPHFTEQVITTNAEDARSVHAVDIDGDGDTDVLSASRGDDTIAWYENDGSTDPVFTEHVITNTASLTESVYPADIDGDGDTDVVFGSVGDDKIAWYENDGNTDPTFTEQVITTSALTVREVLAADLDGDSDTDLLSNNLNWYENDGTANPSFTKHEIVDAEDAISIYTTDVDGDGDTDIFSAPDDSDKILWYENDGAASPNFTEHLITNKAFRSQAVHATDIDGDSDPDVLSASEDDDKIAWYENTRGVLPGVLPSFSARTKGSKVTLSWATTTETNENGFYVQHRAASTSSSPPNDKSLSRKRSKASSDDWTRLNFIDGKRGLSDSTFYEFNVEKDLQLGKHQFRLRKINTDGTSSLSKTVSVQVTLNQQVRLTEPAPNPVETNGQFTFAVKQSTNATVSLYNMLGQQVAILYDGKPTPKEPIPITLDANRFASGMYVIQLRANGIRKIQKVAIVK